MNPYVLSIIPTVGMAVFYGFRFYSKNQSIDGVLKGLISTSSSTFGAVLLLFLIIKISTVTGSQIGVLRPDRNTIILGLIISMIFLVVSAAEELVKVL